MIKYEDVYQALSFHEWRNPLQLVDIIAKQKDISQFRVSLGAVHLHLHRLYEERYADKRERQLTQEQLEVRGGKKGYEYKLTQDGLRKRIEIDQQSTEGIEATLDPAKA